MLQATMQDRWLHFGNVVAMGRAAFGDDVLPCLSAVYVAVWIQLFGGLCLLAKVYCFVAINCEVIIFFRKNLATAEGLRLY
jgi:hypothetical protein